ncbi:lipid kinase, YegS/Rv2252/BmrU family [Cyclobacterium lianum]|uniref:Lipid kinase, YegS/Rv2252/BmrU family n=1 Tax=Cyclobacterium lianum TaxID=388280 RepID=A0A1M7PA48_9BACT|nr:diacylglycerol kinase family protein [Cyclobacterium lianum]SHN13684.1 lipid kinase, YegS/Rv2252/BmrU family [Cyclobacterium lianum]
MVKQHALFILNPYAGDIPDKDEIVRSICDQLENYTLWKTTGEDDGRKIGELLEEKSYDLILVGGGDGTIKMVAEAVKDKNCSLLPVPFGSANGLATCLGIETWEDSLESLQQGQQISMDLLDVNGQTCLHLSDFGLNAGMIKKFEEGDERGMAAYFKSSLSSLFEIKPYPFRVCLEGKNEDIEAKMLIVANGSKYGTGATINPGSSMDDGVFEIIAINPDGFQEWLELTYAVMREDFGDLDFVKVWSSSQVDIYNSGKAPFHVDGEIIEPSERVSIRVKEHKINFYWNPGAD